VDYLPESAGMSAISVYLTTASLVGVADPHNITAERHRHVHHDEGEPPV